jgi:hypothetical protein
VEKECIEDLCGKARRRRPLEKSRSRRDNNTEIDLRGQDDVVWTGLVWLRVGSSVAIVETVMNL